MIESTFLIHVVTEFAKLFGELLVLFVGISFLVALIQVYVSPERVKRLLTAKNKLVSSILGATLGTVTPFCSCSTIPVLSGLLKSGAPFCGIVSFLLTSPVLNPAIITLFIAFFGLKAALVYAGFVLSLAIVIGLLLDKFGFIKEVKEVESKRRGCCSCSNTWENMTGTFFQKQVRAIKVAANNSRELFSDVVPYLLVGASIGAFIHEVIPTDFLANFAGKNQFWAIPAAAVVGIPMYIRTETMIPVASILMTKGVAPGVVIALIIGGAGASLPELSLLSSLFKKKMLFTFVSSVFIVAIVTGCVFNILL